MGPTPTSVIAMTCLSEGLIWPFFFRWNSVCSEVSLDIVDINNIEYGVMYQKDKTVVF